MADAADAAGMATAPGERLYIEAESIRPRRPREGAWMDDMPASISNRERMDIK